MSPPRVSLLLLVYNQRGTVAEAVASCLAQTGPPIELLLSDDASTDGSFELMAQATAAYSGPHRVLLNRNPVNLGIGAHLNRLVELSSGELLLIAAGDDASLPQRCERIAAAWEAASRRPDLIASPLRDMAADGSLHGSVAVDDLSQWDLARFLRERPLVIGAGQAWTRRAFERFGPFDPAIAYEDQVMCFRALAGGGAITLAEPLVNYRRGGTSAKTLPQTAEGVRERMRVQNRRHLVEVEQLRRDADTAGLATQVHPALQPEWDRQRCLAALLASTGWQTAWQAAQAWPALPWAWRLRKLWAVRAAGLTAWRYRRRARR
jgi:GT2 family glycosyltransferase